MEFVNVLKSEKSIGNLSWQYNLEILLKTKVLGENNFKALYVFHVHIRPPKKDFESQIAVVI